MKNNNQIMSERYASVRCNTPWTKLQKNRQKYNLMSIAHNNADIGKTEKEAEQNA